MRLRRMTLEDDTASRLEGCSVALFVGAQYRTLLARDIRQLVSEPLGDCSQPAPTGSAQRLIVRGISAAKNGVVLRMTYVRGLSTHEEDFSVQRPSSNPDGRWVATEFRVYDAL